MRAITCTAEPFGYGPSSSLAQIATRMASLAPEAGPGTDDRVRALAGIAQASYLGSGLDYVSVPLPQLARTRLAAAQVSG